MHVPNSPLRLGLPFDTWRPHQRETVEFIIRSQKDVVIVQAPTGSGKSLSAAALGSEGCTVRILTKTKSLQQQYAEGYNTSVLYGMNNYPCDISPFFNADLCLHADNMRACPSANHCQYLIQRTETKKSHRQALSYVYFLAASWPHQFHTNYLYMDEAHELPKIVMSHGTLRIKANELKKIYGISTHWPSQYRIPSQTYIKRQIAYWLNAVIKQMGTEEEDLLNLMKRIREPRIAQKIRFLHNQSEKFHFVYRSLFNNPDAFYVSVTPEYLEIMPLTPRLDFRRLFIDGWKHKAICTSATIGNPESFAGILGIDSSTYDFMEVPSIFTPDQMPIYVPVNAPKLNYSSTEGAYQKQAKIIAQLLRSLPPEWNGIIHTASIRHAKDLAQRLSRLGYEDRVYIAEGRGTNEKLSLWMKRLKKVPNTLCVSYSFHEGVDAWFSQINIIAKIPFASLNDVTRARIDYDRRLYSWQAGVLTEQAAGRIRRGELARDYESPGEPIKKFVAIVDAGIWQIKRNTSKHFQKCLVKV